MPWKQTRLWVVGWRYDYHNQAEVIVEAVSKEEALKKAKEAVAKEGLSDLGHMSIDDIEPLQLPYINHGCDC